MREGDLSGHLIGLTGLGFDLLGLTHRITREMCSVQILGKK